MFGVAPVRTRSNYKEPALSSRPSTEMGAESALQRTRSLLEGANRQHKTVVSNYRLAADVRTDELAALSLLRTLLEELEICILENENPPPSVSKRKALIKVEKARRGVLAAVRECAGHVTESQKLLEQIERFIELRPDEPVSPRNFNLKWTRKMPQLRHSTKRRDPVPGRQKRAEESLVMSIVGLSAIAEGGERDTPTSDAGGPAAQLPPAPASRKKLQIPTAPSEPTPRRNKDTDERGLVQEKTASAGSGVSGREYGCCPTATAVVAEAVAATAVQTVHDAALMLQQMQQQPTKLANSLDAEDDLRASVSHDVVPSAECSTTMCNLDSCVSGVPPRGTGSSAAGAGGEATESNIRSCGGTYCDATLEDDVDEDEVNSAERDAGSPDHRVSLLGCAKTAAAAVAAAAAATAAAAAATQSTASTPPRRQNRRPCPVEVVAAVAPQVVSAAPVMTGAGTEGVVMRHQESIITNRLYLPTESRRRTSGTNAHAMADAIQLPLPAPLLSARGAGMSFVPSGGPEATLLAEGSQAEAAAAELDAISLTAAAAAAAAAGPPPAAVMTQRLLPSQTRYVPTAPRRVSGASEAGLPPLHHSQHLSLTSVAGAAVAVAPHPYGADGYPHAHAHHHHPTANSADAHHPDAPSNLNGPDSLPSSLREFRMVGAGMRVGNPVTASGASGGSTATAAIRTGPRYASIQLPSGHQSLDIGQMSVPPTPWDNVSLADTEPAPGAQGRSGRGDGRRRGGGGLLGVVRNVVGFLGVSVLSGAAMALGAAAVNTGLDEQEASQAARHRQKNGGRAGKQRMRRGGDDLIPQRTLQQLRSPDLLALGRG